MRELIMSAKTVEDAVQAACESLGVDRDDLNVSYEVLEFPAKKFFRTVPAKVKVTVQEPETAAAAPTEAPAAETSTPAPVPAAPAAEPAAEAPAAPAESPAADAVDLAAEPRLQAAIDYLRPIFELLGTGEVTFSAVRSGETVVLRVDGEHLGALIGRRGETMEALSYLASLVVNHTDGPYIKLGIDVGGYRAKREADLTALARRIAERVKRSGYCYELEPMNPYERHIVHTAVSDVEGVRSESKGEGPERRVVIYSTDPNASNQPDRSGYRAGRGQGGRPRRDRDRRGGGRGERGGRSFDQRGGRGRSPRGARRDGGYRGGSSVPEREFADRTFDPEAQPTVPSRTERIHDGDEFAFGKIEF